MLDVGCGNGDFLVQAQRAGWRALGVDPDPRRRGQLPSSRTAARARARSRPSTCAAGSLDAVTFAHVIEHLHHPRRALARAHELLRPGGVLWLATPNLSSAGHARFGRGLARPRPAAAPRRLHAQPRWSARSSRPGSRSTRARRRRSPRGSTAGAHGSRVTAVQARRRVCGRDCPDARALVRPARAEELLLVARRP